MNISKIHPYEKNAKVHTKKQIKQIARSIEEFGFNQPIVVDRHGAIIVGHGRYEAALYLGLTEVPVLELKNITEEKARAYRLADNKLNESKWDRALLIQELKELDLAKVDITVTGFENDMLMTQEERDDMVPVKVKSKSKLGSMYQLGDHFLLCGDATKEEDVDRLMQGEKADCVFTDPLYNVNYKGTGKKTKTGIMNDAMGSTEFDMFLDSVFKNYRRVLSPRGGAYVFHSTTTQAQFEHAMKKNGFLVKNQIIWNKPAAAMGWSHYRWKHEPMFYASIQGNKVNFYGDRSGTTIWDFHTMEADLVKWARHQLEAERNGLTTIWTLKRDSGQDYVHPTQKPVELVGRALINSSKSGQRVVDFFGGSGSTLITCEKLGRKAHIMELDPRFVDIIIQRWEDYTGNKAEKI
jgi:DNA modification methylase